MSIDTFLTQKERCGFFMMRRFSLFLSVITILALVFSGCSVSKEKIKEKAGGLSKLAEELNNAIGDNSSENDNDGNSEKEEGTVSENSEDGKKDVTEKHSWPEKGYESLPKLEKGNTTYFIDYSNYFTLVNENVSKKDFEEYQNLLLEKGYVLMDSSGISYNYMLGDKKNPKSLVGITYQDNIITISGSLN